MSEELFPQVATEKLSVTVAQRIRDTVRDMQPGTRLPSLATIATQLGVGRSTVREALTGLEALGVVEVRHGQGIFVAERLPGVTLADSLAPSAVEARTLVEIQLAGLAARRRTDAQLAELSTLLDRHAAQLALKEGPILATTGFHLCLIDAAHNEILAAVVRPFLKVAFERGPALYQTEAAYADNELVEHREVFAAIKDRDEQAARERMTAHLGTMNTYYLK